VNRPPPKLNPAYTGFAALIDRVTVRVYEQHGTLTKAVARALIDAFVREVGDVAVRDGRCPVPGLGVLYRATTVARNITNPVTGSPMRLPARWRVALRASQRRGVVTHEAPQFNPMEVSNG
jgi:nucleoid DNA-binding protein